MVPQLRSARVCVMGGGLCGATMGAHFCIHIHLLLFFFSFFFWGGGGVLKMGGGERLERLK